MAHHLVDLEHVCNEILEKLAAAKSPSLTLTELSADGSLRTLPVTEELVQTYIERDFGVSRWYAVDYSS